MYGAGFVAGYLTGIGRGRIEDGSDKELTEVLRVVEYKLGRIGKQIAVRWLESYRKTWWLSLRILL